MDLRSLAQRHRYRHLTSMVTQDEATASQTAEHVQYLSFSFPRFASHVAPALNLVLPEYGRGAIFAGIKTALEFGTTLAASSGMNLRLISMRRTSPQQKKAVVEFCRGLPGVDVLGSVSALEARDMISQTISGADYWMATHWTTAFALQTAVDLGRLDRRRIFYLVQDYEPCFLPSCADQMFAAGTYHAGFTMVTNSTPLAEYLRRTQGVEVRSDLVLAPKLDLSELEQVSIRRLPSREPRLLFYARPSKPRNGYVAGATALVLATRELRRRGCGVLVTTAGEDHPLIRGVEVEQLGRLSWSNYYSRLAETDVMFSLQLSPHPSHPPLDAVSSGAHAILNDFGDTRRDLHNRLHVAGQSVRELADKLVEVLAGGVAPTGFDPSLLTKLGLPSDLVVESLLNDIDV